MASPGQDEAGLPPIDPIAHLRMTDEERKILKECQSESFFRRALPFSCVSVAVVNLLVRSGKLAPNPKYGAIPKSIVAAATAYVIGKASYIPVCRKKILDTIPESELGIQIRTGQNRPRPDQRPRQDTFMRPKAEEKDEYSKFRNTLPTDAPSYEGLKDSERPSMDNEVKMPDASEEKKPITYDELRKRNRQEFQDGAAPKAPPNQPGAPYMPDRNNDPSMPQEPPQYTPPPAAPKRKRTNMWGDVIED